MRGEVYMPVSVFATFAEEQPHCALMGTLSKVGFAGIRVGWVRIHEALSAELEKVRQPFNLGSASQVVATLALTDLAPLLEEHVTTIVSERQRLAAELDQVLPAHDLRADESPLDVRVDLARCCPRRSSCLDGPSAALVFAAGQKTNQFELFTTKDGLLGNNFYGLLMDNNSNLW